MKTYHVFTDGACRPNPGDMAIGVSILCLIDCYPPLDPEEIHTISKLLGHGTNNVAEYSALVEAAKWLKGNVKAGSQVVIHMDSELAVKQMRNEYHIGNEALRTLYAHANFLLEEFKWEIKHVKRESNSRADELANLAYNNRPTVNTQVDDAITYPNLKVIFNVICANGCYIEIVGPNIYLRRFSDKGIEKQWLNQTDIKQMCEWAADHVVL